MAYDYGGEAYDLKNILDMYHLVSGDEKTRRKALRKINLTIRTLNSLHRSPFETIDVLDILTFDIKDIIKILHNTPVQLKRDDRFIKTAIELIHELTEHPKVRNIDLIKEILEEFLEYTIYRIDQNSTANGLILFLLSTEVRVSSTMLTKVQRQLEDSIGEVMNDDLFNM